METGRAKETGRLTATERAEVVGTVRAVASTGTRLVVPSIAIAVAAKRDVRDMGVILGLWGLGSGFATMRAFAPAPLVTRPRSRFDKLPCPSNRLHAVYRLFTCHLHWDSRSLWDTVLHSRFGDFPGAHHGHTDPRR